jgi:hypothetical protein
MNKLAFKKHSSLILQRSSKSEKSFQAFREIETGDFSLHFIFLTERRFQLNKTFYWSTRGQNKLEWLETNKQGRFCPWQQAFSA